MGQSTDEPQPAENGVSYFREVLTGESEILTIADIVARLGQRSFGLALLIFLLPMCLPMPPGLPMAVGVLVCIFGVQLMLGHENIWLPRWLARKEFKRKDLVNADKFANKYLGWLFKLARPRYSFFTGATSLRIAGFVFALLGFLMILPIIFIANMLPAMAGSILALGVTNRDGLIIILGFVASALTTGATILMAIGVWSLVENIF
jgi:hypothetical protein